MIAAGVPCIPGYHGPDQDIELLRREAANIGYPVLLKAVKGGGGKGMRIVSRPSEFDQQLESAKSEAMNSFGDDVMLVEKYITTPRHIEVQIFADKHGNCVALGERDCSIQRRHQKILEESPAPHLPQRIRDDLWDKARTAALAVGYEGAGTVEFIFDNETGQFFFMEMNTRLQVEHPVTEMVTGQDLVHWQFLVASGEKLPLQQHEVELRILEHGFAIEARIYAENPDMNFIPDSGRLVHLKTPVATDSVRVDAGFVKGDEVSSHYDPMIAKLIVKAPTRHAAVLKLKMALEDYEVAGPATNIEFLKRICETPAFIAGEVETGFIQKHHDELFAEEWIPDEVYAQAALGLILGEMSNNPSTKEGASASPIVGFDLGLQQRQLLLRSAQSTADASPIEVRVQQQGGSTFNINVAGTSYDDVEGHMDGTTRVLKSFFPHTRLTACFIREGDSISLFQRGKHYKLACSAAGWVERALGIKDINSSVLAPMPCKILRVQVKVGDTVVKDQPLVVIESMKMETVIRSPQDGTISKIIHRDGDLCKAGTALVEFEESSGHTP
ncbi:MAG: hypothetical protein M1825_001280 [Sarcosagium campestre]|nr:MAG: hypothetical protein M1825_001280 [Sarcosagium campestre]